MQKTLRIHFETNNRKSLLYSCLQCDGWVSNNTTAISEKKVPFIVYKPAKGILNEDRTKRGLHFIYRLLTLLLFFITSLASAQHVLVGLTSNGGPEGKGTAYFIKTDTKAFNVIKGFADWWANPC